MVLVSLTLPGQKFLLRAFELCLKKAKPDLVCPPQKYHQGCLQVPATLLVFSSSNPFKCQCIYSDWCTDLDVSKELYSAGAFSTVTTNHWQNFLRQNKMTPYNSLFLHKITRLVSASFCGLKSLVVKCLTLFNNQELFYYIVFVCSVRGCTREKQQALLHAIRAFRGTVPRGPGHTSALLETVTRRFVLTGWGFVQTSRFRKSKVQAFGVYSVTVCREMSELIIYSKN